MKRVIACVLLLGILSCLVFPINYISQRQILNDPKDKKFIIHHVLKNINNKKDTKEKIQNILEKKREEMLEAVINDEIETETEMVISEEPNYKDMSTPSNNFFKSYMDFRKITNTASEQHALQQKAYTDALTGIRIVDGRYCIAVGSFYATKIGTYIDLIMQNGSIIKCILADCKADEHTDDTNRQNPNGSIAEFVVDVNVLDDNIKLLGDVSYVSDSFNGEIKYIRVYE